MTLSPADASAALQDVAAAEARSVTLRGYQSSAPHMIIWGIVWAVAYTVSDLAPAWANLAWSCLMPVGIAGDIVAARADRTNDDGIGAFVGALFAIAAIFVVSTLAIMAPHDPRQIGAFIPLVVAGAYAILGLFDGPRLLILGGALAALTLFGFFFLQAHFLLWMAAIGGGSLILGGLWLRRV
jgi:hypothetical protein